MGFLAWLSMSRIPISDLFMNGIQAEPLNSLLRFSIFPSETIAFKLRPVSMKPSYFGYVIVRSEKQFYPLVRGRLQEE